MQLLNLSCLGRPLRLQATMSGWQALYWDSQLVAQREACAEPDDDSVLEFTLTRGEEVLVCRLELSLQWQPFTLAYRLSINGQPIEEGGRDEKAIERQSVADRPKAPNRISIIGLGSLALKLFKSAKVIKVLFAAGSLAAYSWLFSWQFALALIACLVFHEYGHIRAMKYFGMRTKGIYLVPFMGGLALSDDKINTRWQDVVISMMGPFFGLILSVILLLLYGITGIEMLAGIAVFNALLNLFNLLPVLPLDGGHILKSITFSMNSLVGLIACVVGALLGVFFSYSFGMALLGFLLIIGSVEILIEWRGRHASQLLPLNRYAQSISAIWYVLTVTGLCAIIWMGGHSGNDALALPLRILGS